ncbi:unnamed protein product, partial [marine sediment metagenome]
MPSTNLVDPPQELVDFVNDYGYLNVSIDLSNMNQIELVKKNITLFKNTVIKHCIIP